jgi:hypothetical protein
MKSILTRQILTPNIGQEALKWHIWPVVYNGKLYGTDLEKMAEKGILA